MTVEESIAQLTIVIGGLTRVINETAAKVDVLIKRAREDATDLATTHEVQRIERDVEELRVRVLDLETHPRLSGNGAAE